MAKTRSESRSQRIRNPIIRYFVNTMAELRKVTWPTRAETIRLTLIVLVFTIIAMAFLGTLDILFQTLAGLLV